MLQLVTSALDKPGLSCPPSLLTLGRHVNAGTNQASLPYQTSRYTRLYSKQMQKHSHMRAYLNKIKQTFVSTQQLCTGPSAIHPLRHCREGLKAAASVRRQLCFDSMSDQVNRENISKFQNENDCRGKGIQERSATRLVQHLRGGSHACRLLRRHGGCRRGSCRRAAKRKQHDVEEGNLTRRNG